MSFVKDTVVSLLLSKIFPEKPGEFIKIHSGIVFVITVYKGINAINAVEYKVRVELDHGFAVQFCSFLWHKHFCSKAVDFSDFENFGTQNENCQQSKAAPSKKYFCFFFFCL